MTAFAQSPHPPIKSTGMKGFLKWYQREQPEVYKVIADKLPAVAPSVFGAYIASRVRATRALGALATKRAKNHTRLMVSGLGQDDSGLDLTPIDVSGDFQAPVSLTAGDLQSVGTSDISAVTLPDVADTAGSSAGTPTTNTSAISNLIAGVTGLFTSQQQLQTAQQITNLQLQRAQAGLAPLNIGMNANGVPTVTGIASNPMTLLLLLGAGLLLFLGMGRKKAA